MKSSLVIATSLLKNSAPQSLYIYFSNRFGISLSHRTMPSSLRTSHGEEPLRPQFHYDSCISAQG